MQLFSQIGARKQLHLIRLSGFNQSLQTSHCPLRFPFMRIRMPCSAEVCIVAVHSAWMICNSIEFVKRRFTFFSSPLVGSIVPAILPYLASIIDSVQRKDGCRYQLRHIPSAVHLS